MRTNGDRYVAGFVVLGTFGWLAVATGTIFASIVDKRRLVVLLPLAWFLAFSLPAFVVGMAIGPAPCPS